MNTLKINSLTLAMSLLLLTVATGHLQAQGFDRIRHRNGIDSGEITSMNALSVTIAKGGVNKKMPVEQILSISFAGEPSNLARARKLAETGRYLDAQEKLKEVNASEIQRAEIKQELEFYLTLCQAQLALAGQSNLDAAEARAKKFLSSNSKSYHVPAIIELLGDVLLADGDFRAAREQYSKLAKAPAAYFKARSYNLTGLAFQAEGLHSEALTAFDQSLQAAKENSLAKSIIPSINLHRAVSQASTGNANEAIDTVNQIIAQANSKDSSQLAMAYNALGDCHLQSGNNKAALHAFLHVDLLFSSVVNEHAKALHQLSQLWKEFGKNTRALDAQKRLQEKYPNSPWLKK